MNSISTPLVSVMIPYYNCKDYIAETIESIEAQTYSTKYLNKIKYLHS